MESTAIGQLEATTIFDEQATAYNVIITQHGNFILSNYEGTATDADGTVHQVKWPIDGESSDLHQQEEVIILSTSENDEHFEYQKYVN